MKDACRVLPGCQHRNSCPALATLSTIANRNQRQLASTAAARERNKEPRNPRASIASVRSRARSHSLALHSLVGVDRQYLPVADARSGQKRRFISYTLGQTRRSNHHRPRSASGDRDASFSRARSRPSAVVLFTIMKYGNTRSALSSEGERSEEIIIF